MSIMFMLLCVVARAADPHPFPTRVTAQLRGVVRAYLDGSAPTAALDIVSTARIDAVSLVVSGLDEVDSFVRRSAGNDPTHRVGKVVDWLMGLEIGPGLSEPERKTLRAILRPFLARSRAAKVFAPVVHLYRRLDLFDEEDAEFVVGEIPTVAGGLIDRFDLVVRLAAGLSPSERAELAAAIRSNTGNPIVRFALLDEIGLLPERQHVPTLLGVRQALRPAPGHRPGERERRERRAYLRLLARWQTRWQDGDPAVVGALAQLETRSETEAELKFLSEFRAHRLRCEATDARLYDDDPLELSPPPPPATNVVELAACRRRLAGAARSE